MTTTAEPTKVCCNAGCPWGRRPWSAFYQTTHKSGRTYRSGRCKECHRDWLRVHRDTPEHRARHAARERRRLDPIRRAARAERARLAKLAARRRLPAAPFAAWVREVVIPPGASLSDPGVADVAARRLGMEEVRGERLLRRLRDGQRWVLLSTVDKAVTAWGDTGALDRMYPLE